MAKARPKSRPKRPAKAPLPPRHRSFRRTPRPAKTDLATVPSTLSLLRETCQLLWQGKWLFGRLVLLHAGLLVLLALDPVSDASQVYVFLLLVLMSMAEIWLIRRLSSDEPVAVKPALYQGTAQVVPFGLSVLLLVLQLLPFVVGLWLFQIVVIEGIAIHLTEQALFAGLWLGLGLLSWYWVATSLLSLYIVTLPAVMPMQAWHTAKPLVEGRRAILLLRVLVLFASLVVLGYGLVLLIPADWLVNYNLLPLVIAALLPIWHIYLYKLYRALV